MMITLLKQPMVFRKERHKTVKRKETLAEKMLSGTAIRNCETYEDDGSVYNKNSKAKCHNLYKNMVNSPCRDEKEWWSGQLKKKKRILT